MNFRDYVFAAFATAVMGTLTVFYWLLAISTVDKLGSDTGGVFIIYIMAVLASVGCLYTSIRVWRE